MTTELQLFKKTILRDLEESVIQQIEGHLLHLLCRYGQPKDRMAEVKILEAALQMRFDEIRRQYREQNPIICFHCFACKHWPGVDMFFDLELLAMHDDVAL